MREKYITYKNILIPALRELADRDYQQRVWLNAGGKPIMSLSFIEAANNVFDDAYATEILENNQIVYDKKVTEALRELGVAIDAVDEFRSGQEIINDPLMEVVRQKAARALFLINVSTGEGGTVEIVEQTH
jgi:hypothetical protein